MESGPTPLALHWTFGFSRNVANGVYSVKDGESSTIFYPSANTGVIYNYTKRSQKLLQGHCNQISCVALSNDRKCLVTADSGLDSLMVVWDTRTCLPTKTMFNAASLGMIAVDISADNLYLATLSTPDEPNLMSQQLAIWQLNSTAETPISSEEVPNAYQTALSFHPLDSRILITNGSSLVLFWSWHTDLSCYAPHFSRRDFRQAIGQLTVSVFLPGTTQAVTGTSDGAIILWDHPTGVSAQSSLDSNLSDHEQVAVKIVRLCRQSINHLSTVGNYLVVAGDDGSVRLYDFLFRLEAWFEDIDAGAITSVSFAGDSTSMVTSRTESLLATPNLSYVNGMQTTSSVDAHHSGLCTEVLSRNSQDSCREVFMSSRAAGQHPLIFL